MRRDTAVGRLASYVDAVRPIIYIHHFDFEVVDAMIRRVAGEVPVHEYNHGGGAVHFDTKVPQVPCDLAAFLDLILAQGQQHALLVLKDVHDRLNDPVVLARLKALAARTMYRPGYQVTTLVVSGSLVIPPELEPLVTVFEVPPPGLPEIARIIEDFAQEQGVEAPPEVVGELAVSLKGLDEFQIVQILNLAYQDGGDLALEDKELIRREKEQVIKKSGRLEIVQAAESIDSIGGLENLKDWLERKARVFQHLDRAIRFRVDVPKGLLVVGMPGCGKSLAAKATARVFGVPLLRLDVGRLFGRYVGESEDNMHRALRTAEAVSPCVLWVDEIEKAFTGLGGGDSGSGVTTRLFGQFLTWMQEKESTVFVVATANDISSLPAEFLRKGRFDEIFSVDLPCAEERRAIFEVHLRKRQQLRPDLDVIPLLKLTDGFTGADVEAAVREAVEDAFIEGHARLSTDDLKAAVGRIRPFESTHRDKVQVIRKELERLDVRPASRREGQPTGKTNTA